MMQSAPFFFFDRLWYELNNHPTNQNHYPTNQVSQYSSGYGLREVRASPVSLLLSKSGFLLYCVGYGIREYSFKPYLTLVGGRTGVANSVHLAGPERVHHTTSAMGVLPADASALVICELRWAWRVVGDSCAATARCAGNGVRSC